MNGVHDLGGMQDFGPVVREENEPVFHEPWEAAVVAMTRASRRAGITNIDESRHGIERLEPVRYLESSYYERWLEREIMLLLEKGIITEDELTAAPASLPPYGGSGRGGRQGTSAGDATSRRGSW